MANVKIYKCLPQIFALALTVSEIKKHKMFAFQKTGHGHGVCSVELIRSMANVKIYKSPIYFCVSTYHFRNIKMLIFDLQSVGQRH